MNDSYLDHTFTFKKRPTPLDVELRIAWRLPLTLLLLRNCCREAKSSISRLSLLSSAVQDKGAQAKLLDTVSGLAHPGDILMRVDPTLNQILDYSVAEGLIQFSQDAQVQLTAKGAQFVADFETKPELFEQEKRFMKSIGKKLSEKKAIEIQRSIEAIIL
jgi:hypothetical protein